MDMHVPLLKALFINFKISGMGDMLYAPLGCGKPLRVQGAFVSDEERDAIVSFIKEQSTANYSEDIIAQIEKAAEDKSSDSKGGELVPVSENKPDYDELLPQAVDVIFDTKQASVSMLQRRLKLGYSRAARIIDQMEEMTHLEMMEVEAIHLVSKMTSTACGRSSS